MTQEFLNVDDPCIYEELWNAIKSEDCILEVGSGLSAQARTKGDKHPPAHWRDVLKGIAKWCIQTLPTDKQKTKVFYESVHKTVDEGHLLEAEQKTEEFLGKKNAATAIFERVLLCNEAEVGEAHLLIAEIPFRAFFTVNYDMFIETAYVKAKGLSLAKFYEASIDGAVEIYQSKKKDLPFILKLHGDVDNLASIKLSDRNFTRLSDNAKRYKEGLQTLLFTSSVLSIGFEQADCDLNSLLYQAEISNTQNKYWMVVPEEPSVEHTTEQAKENREISIIKCKSNDELLRFLELLRQPWQPLSTLEEEIKLDKVRRKSATFTPSIPKSVSGIEVFIAYAPEDERYMKDLEKRLVSLRRSNMINFWDDKLIIAGQEWKLKVEEHLKSADIILLLISQDFIASEFSNEVHLTPALARHREGNARVIPIIVRPSTWKEEPFSKLKPLPENGEPISQWSNEDSAYLDVYFGIQRAIKEINDAQFPPLRLA